MNLKDLVVDRKSAWVKVPGMLGFEVEVVNLSRKALNKLRKKCTSQKFDRKSRQMEEILNDELFVQEFSKATVKNWKGLTIEKLEKLLLVDVEGKDINEEIPYSQENAEILISGSTEFDTFVNDVVFDLDSFRSRAED